MQQQIDLFSLAVEIPVLWRDMDAFAHVNNAVYLQYFESARVEYFTKIGFGYSGVMPEVGPILKSTMCKFRFPLTYPDTILSATKTISLTSDRFVMSHGVFSKRHNRIVAEGEGVIVAFNYSTNTKAHLPSSVIQAIKNIERCDFSV